MDRDRKRMIELRTSLLPRCFTFSVGEEKRNSRSDRARLFEDWQGGGRAKPLLDRDDDRGPCLSPLG